MRGVLLLSALLALAACEPDDRPKASAAAKVVRNSPSGAAFWPALLQHCLRSPNCDPLSDFGQGAGQASGVSGSASWFVESKDTVKEGGEDYGAAITISVFGPRGQGGPGGRPLTLDEAPNSLRGTNARRSRLSIEYRTPGGATPEPYALQFRSAELAIAPPADAAPKTRRELIDATAKHLEEIAWPGGGTGARVEIALKRDVLFTGYSDGVPSESVVGDEISLQRGFEPFVFLIFRNIRHEPVAPLMQALSAGETLSLRIAQAANATMLEDGLYAEGYSEALAQAVLALSDQRLAQPLTQRCNGLQDKDDAFWMQPDLHPVLHACDPRTPEQRRTDVLSARARESR